MRCPACQNSLIENDVACRQCGFTLEAADRAFGIPPALTKPVADLTGELPGSARRKLLRASQAFLNRHPQLDLAVVLSTVPAHIPLGVYAFWLFNRGQLSSPVATGGANRLVLLVIDSAGRRVAAMAGYGLEPFLPEGQIQMCLQSYAQTSLREGTAAAITAFWKELDIQLSKVHLQIPRQFGLKQEEAWVEPATGAPMASSRQEGTF